MRITQILLVLMAAVWLASARAATIEVAVHGMTCSFCADGLQRNLDDLEEVQRADVSLKHKKVRIVFEPGATIDIERIKRAVIDAGFTPVDVKTIADTP